MLWSHRERLRAWGWEVVGTEDDQQLAAAPIVEGVELGVPAMREYAAVRSSPSRTEPDGADEARQLFQTPPGTAILGRSPPRP